MKNSTDTMLVTCAFPYANGDIHLGHLLEHIQADIWIRYYRMKGRSVIFICSDDAHGTAIMLQAKKMKINPERLIENVYQRHRSSFLKFSIFHDHYSSTHSKTNEKTCKKIFNILKRKDLIQEKVITQLYDVKLNIFLSDRFVRGTCPTCRAKRQYGDNCEICGAIYDATELLNPVSELSNSSPQIKSSKHLFFKLSYFSEFLKRWVNSGTVQASVANHLNRWLAMGLRSWNISRDKPYFGFLIPGYVDKFFYVWMDAPIGYISSFKELCNEDDKINFCNFWSRQSKHELYHFIGKDIVYFHSLFWPAILEGCDYRKPTKIFAHGYLKFNGSKLSKSKGTIISVDQWLSYFDSDSLRYYLASKLSDTIEDIEINVYDYAYKINSDIVNNIINLASRSASFLKKHFFNILSDCIIEKSIYKNFVDKSIEIDISFQERKFSLVVKAIRNLSDIANKYINTTKPWILIKQKSSRNYVHGICSLGINLFRILMIFLKPIMPNLVRKSELFLNTPLQWTQINKPLLNHKINDFSCLYERIKISYVDEFMRKI
ncbi:methionine--tRNA ligase [Buchnera aphidicola]|uniref:methionine--tRNA ligase n=1 Tax=Buchnera aphidicola TaxID=9 RepID=UPI00094DAB84|nr:methionine--tRNA ligase [Buchnera aphidicola]